MQKPFPDHGTRPGGRITLERVIAALAAGPGEARSDYDLNPGAAALAPEGRRLRAAAVLCGLVTREAGLAVILTQRPETMREHPGQIAFPGGKIDPGDADATAAALREAEEEIGLPPTHVRVLGRLGAYETGTGFSITPVIGAVDPGFAPRPDPREVAHVFEAPLDALLHPDLRRRSAREWNGAMRHFWEMPWEGRRIWGATAGMLKALSDRLDAAP